MPNTPNVLLVVTDQERADMTAPDGPAVDTPAADRLAREGMRCERAYTPTAICSPARVSILTGLYPHNHVVLSNPSRPAIDTSLQADHPTIGEQAQAAGYATSYVGKWHVEGSSPADGGFEKLTGGLTAAIRRSTRSPTASSRATGASTPPPCPSRTA